VDQSAGKAVVTGHDHARVHANLMTPGVPKALTRSGSASDRRSFWSPPKGRGTSSARARRIGMHGTERQHCREIALESRFFAVACRTGWNLRQVRPSDNGKQATGEYMVIGDTRTSGTVDAQ